KSPCGRRKLFDHGSRTRNALVKILERIIEFGKLGKPPGSAVKRRERRKVGIVKHVGKLVACYRELFRIHDTELLCLKLFLLADAYARTLDLFDLETQDIQRTELCRFILMQPVEFTADLRPMLVCSGYGRNFFFNIGRGVEHRKVRTRIVENGLFALAADVGK